MNIIGKTIAQVDSQQPDAPPGSAPLGGSAHLLPKPTVTEVKPKMRKYAALPGNSVGGSLHIVLDDGNVDDGSVRHCIEWARERDDVAGVELGEILLRMSRTQRKKLSALFYAPNAPSGRPANNQ